MTTKDADLQKLKKVKVILGNGFDLYCGLHTSYKDYFRQCEKLYKTISSEAGEAAIFLNKNYISKGKDANIHACLPALTQHNPWDVFFALSIEDCSNQVWRDIESEMFESLKELKTNEATNDAKTHWREAFAYMRMNKLFREILGILFFWHISLKRKGLSYLNPK